MSYEIWLMEDVLPDKTFTRTHSASHRFLPNGAVQLRRSRPIARADAGRLRLQSRPRQARLRRGDFQQSRRSSAELEDVRPRLGEPLLAGRGNRGRNDGRRARAPFRLLVATPGAGCFPG